MDPERITICAAHSPELSGGLGGVVGLGVVSVADLKYVVTSGDFHVLDESVSAFVAWRSNVAPDRRKLLKEHFSKFSVVSVAAEDSVDVIASRLLTSKLQRIFLSCDEIARIVGLISSRDILVEVFDRLVES